MLALTGPVMRESDQAALVHGSLELAQRGSWRQEVVGQPGEISPFYLEDKYWGSYLCGAAAIRVAQVFDAEICHDPQALVTATNRGAAAALVAGVLALGAALSLGRPARAGAQLGWLAYLASPVVLLSAPLLSPNACSTAFLLGLLALCRLRPGPVAWAGKGLLALAAVACRADAVLALPLLCWVQVAEWRWRAILARRDFQALGVGALLALAVGRWLVRGFDVGSFFASFSRLDAVAAYLIFGCGVMLLAGVWGIGTLARWPGMPRWARVVAVGLLLAPLGFYATRLYSPRHLLVWLTALLVPLVLRPREGSVDPGEEGTDERKQAEGPFTRRAGRLATHSGNVGVGTSRRQRGRAALRRWVGRRAVARVGGVLVGAGALAPLFCGLLLPLPTRPALVWAGATRYPTTDGLWPMGGLLAFQRALAGPAGVDHHAPIWRAAQAIEPATPGGTVRLLVNPQVTLFGLVARCKGWRLEAVDAAAAAAASEGETLIELGDLQRGIAIGGGEALPGWESGRWRAGPDPQLVVLRATAGPGGEDPDWPLLTLREAFGGARFVELEPVALPPAMDWQCQIPPELRGGTVVWLTGRGQLMRGKHDEVWDWIHGGNPWVRFFRHHPSPSVGLASETLSQRADPMRQGRIRPGQRQDIPLLSVQPGRILGTDSPGDGDHASMTSQASGERPRVFVRQFPDYMRY